MTARASEAIRQQSYAGVALVAPTTFGYAKNSPRGAAWFIGRTLQQMLAATGLEKQAVDGFAVTSFSLGADSTIALTQNFQISPRWIEQVPYGGASGIIALRRAARAVQAGDASIVACIGGDATAHVPFASIAGEFSNFTIDASFPYGGGGPNTAFALITQNYMDQYNARREDFGRVAVAQR
jgi:acetyl-CoA acetyltransferase